MDITFRKTKYIYIYIYPYLCNLGTNVANGSVRILTYQIIAPPHEILHELLVCFGLYERNDLAAVLGQCETFLEPLEKMNGKIGLPTGPDTYKNNQ